MVVDLGVLGGGHEIWAIEVLWWLWFLYRNGWRRRCRWFLFSQGKGCYVLVVGVEVVRC
jgi:hypothetical protein